MLTGLALHLNDALRPLTKSARPLPKHCSQGSLLLPERGMFSVSLTVRVCTCRAGLDAFSYRCAEGGVVGCQAPARKVGYGYHRGFGRAAQCITASVAGLGYTSGCEPTSLPMGVAPPVINECHQRPRRR
jgi:hypothetical protein